MKKHARRSAEEMIRDLETKIRSIRTRADRDRSRTIPAISDALKAIKLIDRATGSTSDATFRTALQEARATLTAAAAVQGVIVPPSASATAALRGRRSPAPPEVVRERTFERALELER